MTLVEVVVGIGVLGIMTVSLYSAFTYAYAEVNLTREEARATQILAERMEVVRLYNWKQVTTPGYIPRTFTAPYYANTLTNPPASSILYKGTVLVTNAPLTESYAPQMKMIQIQVTWPSGKVRRQREMTTFVSQYGFQSYIR